MKRWHMFDIYTNRNIGKEYLNSKEFEVDLILQNIRRGSLLAIIVIAFEMVFVSIDIISFFTIEDRSFSFYSYLTMYLIMIVINLIYLFLINCYRQKRIHMVAIDTLIIIYITLIMIWGGVISLMDQKLYGQLMAFMVNMIVCSIIYLVDTKRMSIPYLTSTLILAVGLPFFQNSSDVLVGHYVNLAVFVVISWISPYLTISLGTATNTMTSTKELSQIINNADQALYLAKNSGRNCIATWSEMSSLVEKPIDTFYQ